LSVAMRTYDMEDVSPALIEEQAALLEKFSARFFGKMPPPLPTEAMLALRKNGATSSSHRVPLPVEARWTPTPQRA
jgi:hypothetical protein